MRYIVFSIIVTIVVGWIVGLGGCTSSSTQWDHRKQQQEECRSTAATEQERTECGSN